MKKSLSVIIEIIIRILESVLKRFDSKESVNVEYEQDTQTNRKTVNSINNFIKSHTIKEKK